MPGTISAKVEGLQKLGESMRLLATKEARGIAVGMTGVGARVIKRAAVRNIEASPSVETGSLRDAVIVKKVPKSEAQYTSEHVVTVRGRGKPANKKGQKIARAPHAHLVEFGTVHMPAEPFLRPAFDSEKMNAVNAMADKGRQRVAKIGTRK